VGIPLHDLLLKLRNRQVEEGLASRPQRAAFKVFESTMRRPALYKISGKAGRGAQKPLLRDGSVRPVSGPMSGWTGSRDLPPLAKKSFRELWKEGL
jgi:L-lactate dehydrogenase complex protein LldF